MKNIALLIVALFSIQTWAIQNLVCKPTKNSQIQVEIQFYRDINPRQPFIGLLEFGAVVKVIHPIASKSYTDKSVRMTPEVYTTDINLRGDSESSRLRLYPQFNQQGEFTNYLGQLFVNDLETKSYFNFVNEGQTPGLVCH